MMMGAIYSSQPTDILVFEPETIAYMNSISIPFDGTIYQASTVYEMTGIERWMAVNDFWLNVKASGSLFSKLLRVGRLFSDDAAMAAVNALDPTKFLGTYYGGWIHDGGGSKGNGTNTYMVTGFNPSIEQTNGDSGLTAVITQDQVASATGGKWIVGAFIADGNNAALGFVRGATGFDQLLARYNESFYGFPNYDMPSRNGAVTVNRLGGSATFAAYHKGVPLGSFTGTGINPNLELWEGAANQNTGVPWVPTDATIGMTIYHAGLTALDVSNMNSAIDEFYLACGNKTW